MKAGCVYTVVIRIPECTVYHSWGFAGTTVHMQGVQSLYMEKQTGCAKSCLGQLGVPAEQAGRRDGEVTTELL